MSSSFPKVDKYPLMYPIYQLYDSEHLVFLKVDKIKTNQTKVTYHKISFKFIRNDTFTMPKSFHLVNEFTENVTDRHHSLKKLIRIINIQFNSFSFSLINLVEFRNYGNCRQVV